ncbi:tyrosine-protein phosphatase [Virgibacillus kekensis]|uniref:Tyrosine-protein phosphatase n=1 Tax=Virgibacillus kekensis TaxID=202261 RepID=A0ABV9DGN4_9BACI
MIDIHCHILPGIDDGAQTYGDSLNMAAAAASQGIKKIIATPHHRNGSYHNIKSDIIAHTTELNQRLRDENIPVEVLPGQETRINGDMVQDLEQGELLPLNETTKYVFVEFPPGHIPRYASQLLFDLQVAGYVPVIVHPERNREIAENPSVIYEFIQKGVLSQITAASICGKFGKNIQKLSHQLIEANLSHFLASDAHNTSSRGFCLAEAYEELQKQHGRETGFLFMENCELLINGRTVNREEAQRIKKKKFLGIF